MSELNITPFAKVYDAFFSKITDYMYMELTERETYSMLGSLLFAAIQWFEFPRVDLTKYVKGTFGTEGYEKYESDDIQGYFESILSQEEINILATYMVTEWMGQQLASIENIRMKYSGSDFKFTSQANHMQKVLQLQKDYERKGFHLQRLYKRRKADENGISRSTFGDIMKSSLK